LKGSSAISARAKAAPRHTGPSSAKPRPTPTTAEEFVLSGPSDLPNPQFNAYRNDLADIALASRVIASHYARAVPRVLLKPAALRGAPRDDAELVRELAPGEPFEMLDETLGWAWGYAGEERRVGYLPSDSLRPS
jgi:hypothetical protein